MKEELAQRSPDTSALVQQVPDSSYMSFDSYSLREPKHKNESPSFSGQAVTHRTRKRFDPVGKAKTALIRYLGACTVCKNKGVTVSLAS
jgi:hypothetical protein